MQNLIVSLLVTGFVVSNAGASLLFKYASARTGWGMAWFYIAGNVVGFFAPLCLMFALRGTNPNVIYALCFGGGFVALQLASLLLFRTPLSAVQWAGIAVVAAGIVLLQWK